MTWLEWLGVGLFAVVYVATEVWLDVRRERARRLDVLLYGRRRWWR